MAEDRTRPTAAQIDCAVLLINELGYDSDWFDVKSMTRLQLANLIIEWRRELAEREEGARHG